MKNFTKKLSMDLATEYAQAPGLFKEIANIESMLAETYRNRVQYELLQNSDDAGATKVAVSYDGMTSFTWENNGRVMDPSDVSGLCRSATSVKERGIHIGYRGIGFKSLAAVSSRITVASGNVKFDFDRDQSADLLGTGDLKSVPLIRIPTNIRSGEMKGARFTVRVSGKMPDLSVEPTALLFLRNIESLTTHNLDTGTLRVLRTPGKTSIESSEGSAEFAMLEASATQVAIPLSAAARRLAGPSGRLACFLPLNEAVGLPVIVSGDVTTDPSRTNAIVDDPATIEVLATAAKLIGQKLRSPQDPHFDDLWSLLLSAPDPRSALLATTPSTTSVFLNALRDFFKHNPPSFAISPVDLDEDSIPALFPKGAPRDLYKAENKTAARALRSALHLPVKSVEEITELVQPDQLSERTRHRLSEEIAANARVQGRPLNESEIAFGASLASSSPESEVAKTGNKAFNKLTASQIAESLPSERNNFSFPEIVKRWRVAETAVVEWLNSRGWTVKDVSKQNLGYDASGTDPNGNRICLEIKKVDTPDSSFAMTTNEWALFQSKSEPTLVAVVVGDGARARLAFFDPLAASLEPTRVARQWEWRFDNWSEFSTWLD